MNLGTLTITNSTLANNSVSYFGGGILNNMKALLTLTNSTLAANFAGSDGGGIMNWATLSVTNSLFGNNTAPTGPDVNNSGTIADARYNVVYQGSASGIVNGVNGNQVGVDPLLDPAGLQDNGGPTQTFALLPGSPALDAGSNDQAVGPDGQPLAYDQRGPGFPRILGGTVDVGAFELLQNQYPVADPGGPYTVAEGGAVDLLGSSSALDGTIVAYAWDLDDDGIFGEASTERGDETLQNPMYSAVGLDGPSSQPVRSKCGTNLGVVRSGLDHGEPHECGPDGHA